MAKPDIGRFQTYHNELWPGSEDHNPLLTAREKEIGTILTVVYPGYSVIVRCHENGGFFLRDPRFNRGAWGIGNPRPKYSTWSELKHDVVMRWGEWLERANEKRGVREPGQELGYVEGIPDKDQNCPKQQRYMERLIVDQYGHPLIG